jgi:hypothetical protein
MTIMKFTLHEYYIKERMRVTSWITKATDTHSEYIIIIALPLQQWLHEMPLILHSTYIACLIKRTLPLLNIMFL